MPLFRKRVNLAYGLKVDYKHTMEFCEKENLKKKEKE